jgi:hypothetical protein
MKTIFLDDTNLHAIKTYSDQYGTFFGRVDEHGNVRVLHVDDGAAATRLDASVFPVLYEVAFDDDARCNEFTAQHTSQWSARYPHPDGIVLTRADAERLRIWIEE